VKDYKIKDRDIPDKRSCKKHRNNGNDEKDSRIECPECNEIVLDLHPSEDDNASDDD